MSTATARPHSEFDPTDAAPLPPPPSRSIVQMQWRDLLFLHWPTDPQHMQRLLPAGLEIDTCDGVAWFGLISFTMPRVCAVGIAFPGADHVLECNVRTYVRCGNQRGVWFFTLDASSRLAVLGARIGWQLNYRHAAITMFRDGDRFNYTLQRRDHGTRRHLAQRYAVSTNADSPPQPMMRCAWSIDRDSPPNVDPSLARFLTERYALFTLDRQGRLAAGRIHHEPWRLCRANVQQLDQSLTAAAGLETADPHSPPLAFHSFGVDARAWPIHPV